MNIKQMIVMVVSASIVITIIFAGMYYIDSNIDRLARDNGLECIDQSATVSGGAIQYQSILEDNDGEVLIFHDKSLFDYIKDDRGGSGTVIIYESYNKDAKEVKIDGNVYSYKELGSQQ